MENTCSTGSMVIEKTESQNLMGPEAVFMLYYGRHSLNKYNFSICVLLQVNELPFIDQEQTTPANEHTCCMEMLCKTLGSDYSAYSSSHFSNI